MDSPSRAPELSAAALRIVEILRPHTPFAEAIVRRQSERAGLSAAKLSREDIPKVVPLVIAASLTFVDPNVIAQLKAILSMR
jgi:hypothetical protein